MPTCVQPNLARVSSSELSPSTLLYSETTTRSSTSAPPSPPPPPPPLHKRASNRYWDIDQNTLQSCEESAIRKLLKEETMAVRDMSSLMFQQKVARSYQMLHDALWKCQKKKYEKHHNTADGRIRIWLGIRQIMNSIDHLLTETRDTVKELKTRIHMGKDKIAEERRIAICIFDDAAVYGLGICVEFGGFVFKPLVLGSLLMTYYEQGVFGKTGI
ncbi:hypothetical protein ACSBR2_027973 [Camellia fascicularis]